LLAGIEKGTIMTQLQEETIRGSSVAKMDMKLEVVVIPVTDVDRAKEFYAKLGWRLDADFRFDNGFRIVQFTPPGSGSSIQFGTNVTTAAPGAAQNSYLVVSDILAARDQLAARGVEVTEVFHNAEAGANFQPNGSSARLNGPSPDHASSAPTPPSPTRTATAGCCRRSPLGWMVASILPRPGLPR